MKRLMILIAAVLAMASTAAIAEDAGATKALSPTSNAVKLSDTELDNITAGTASVLTVVLNPGKASVGTIDPTATRFLCVNCAGFSSERTIVFISNPGQTLKCVGPGAAGVC
jgi:hypothetical protein